MTLSTSSSRAVRTRTGIFAPAARRRRRTSKPSIPGRRTSRTTRSGRLVRRELEALLAGAGDADLVALLLEGVLDPAGDGVLVFDDQDGGCHAAGSYTRRGGRSRATLRRIARPAAGSGRAAAPRPRQPARPRRRCQHQRTTHELRPPRARRRAPHRHRQGRRRPPSGRPPARRRLRPRPRVGRRHARRPRLRACSGAASARTPSSTSRSTAAKPTPVLIHGVQIHPVNRRPIHVDLFVVRMTEELTVDVPVHGTGESEAVTKLGGTLLNATRQRQGPGPARPPAAVDRGRPRRARRLRRGDPRPRPRDPRGRDAPDRPRRDRLQGLPAARPGGRGRAGRRGRRGGRPPRARPRPPRKSAEA